MKEEESSGFMEEWDWEGVEREGTLVYLQGSWTFASDVFHKETKQTKTTTKERERKKRPKNVKEKLQEPNVSTDRSSGDEMKEES